MIKTHFLQLGDQKQNGHLTFKLNQKQGRHGWLRLTPAYSVQLVTNILNAHKKTVLVVDPFSGTGTTALCAAYQGFHSVGIEINPFLSWFSSIKFRQFKSSEIEETKRIGALIAHETTSVSSPLLDPPPIYNISRWWNDEELRFLCRLKANILALSEEGSNERDLLLIAFCRTIIKLSNAAFNHQSMSFKTPERLQMLFEVGDNNKNIFLNDLAFVLEGASDNPLISPTIITGDARRPSKYLHKNCDLVITSPPYPNRISYIRELRPYMYWLGFLTNGRDAGEYDWQAIGGTWGIATSRLTEWKPSEKLLVPSILRKAVTEIAHKRNSNGVVLSNYIAKYFEDMWEHISDFKTILAKEAEVHYIVGNSTFYGVLLPVEEIFKIMFQESGFQKVEILKIRKRNSKAELFEFDVVGWKSQ